MAASASARPPSANVPKVSLVDGLMETPVFAESTQAPPIQWRAFVDKVPLEFI
jgi:hypothetical protein